LQFSVSDIPELATMRFPAMTLLTLVENAVRHGIDPAISGGSIHVDGQLDPVTGRVTLCVRDTGMGMSETAQPGTGLSNSRTRMQAFYGSEARLEIHEEAPHGVRVELHFHPRENI
jgi:LytS/YehU family sensor histidine kinase